MDEYVATFIYQKSLSLCMHTEVLVPLQYLLTRSLYYHETAHISLPRLADSRQMSPRVNVTLLHSLPEDMMLISFQLNQSRRAGAISIMLNGYAIH